LLTASQISLDLPEGTPFGFVHDKFLFFDSDVGDRIDAVYIIEDDGTNPDWILYHGTTYSVVGVTPNVDTTTVF